MSSTRTRTPLRRRVAALAAGVAAVAATTVAPGAAVAPDPAPLTNIAHLDFLLDQATPPEQAGHTTYRLDDEPALTLPWTYADRRDGGVYERIGGGALDPATGHWSQGSYNADDVSRAAVVYLRHWQQTGAEGSRDTAYELLRSLTYLQTATGQNAGNVVLWMQPDGELNPSAEPVELPDPSDSGPSYWLARTIWALGEGYAAFDDADPAFASFLQSRLDLAIEAVSRQVLDEYGTWAVADGKRVPAWLIVDGADASAEAVLGLAAYVDATPDSRTARRALRQLAEGIAAMSAGDAGTWPYGAILPWAASRSFWHGWGSQMPASLASAASVLERDSLLRPAVSDSVTFTPLVLATGGPDNGWLPAPVDRTQIAYGVDSRLQSVLAVTDSADLPGLEHIAGVTAAWYFGANAAGAPMYDPATGRTFDGISGDGAVNMNSGAESTIHGLLSMLALDARTGIAAAAQATPDVHERDGIQVVEAESATLDGPATVVQPESAWTGESQWSGGAYVSAEDGGSSVLDVAAHGQDRWVEPVVDLEDDRSAGTSIWSAGSDRLGRIDHGRAGAQGITEAPGSLQAVALGRMLPAGGTSVEMFSDGTTRVDAVLLRPLVARVVLTGPDEAATALLTSSDHRSQRVSVGLPDNGPVLVQVYDARGRLRTESMADASSSVRVLPGGFTVLTR
ncbi:MAG: hypothetical protein ACRDWI_07115 [Jiangellaceae bacterium]